MEIPMAHFLPNHRKISVLEIAVWAAKIIFLLIGIASTAVLAASFSFPYLRNLPSSLLPKLWSSAVSWLAPPYLFITVHFIIMIIWKLHTNQLPDQYMDRNPPVNSSPLPESSHELFAIEVQAESAPIENRFESEPTSSSDTFDSSEKSTIQQPWPPADTEPVDYAPSSSPDNIDATWQAIMDSKSSSSPVKNQLKKSDAREKTSNKQAKPHSPRTPPTAVAVDRREFRKSGTFKEAKTADLDTVSAKREMRKSKTYRESPTTAGAAVGWRGRDVLVIGRDELFRKVEAFIKMNYEQQKRESEQQCVGILNAAC